METMRKAFLDKVENTGRDNYSMADLWELRDALTSTGNYPAIRMVRENNG